MKPNRDLPSISIVIPTYDEQERLTACLRSLARLDYPEGRVQIVVVDDGSPDFVPRPLLMACKERPVELIPHETNLGRARARNTGLRCATGDLILFLDSDMTVEPDFLLHHAAAHRGQERRVAVGNIRFGPGIPEDALTRYIESRGVHRLRPGDPVPFKCFVTGNSSLRRELLSAVGLFDEAFTAYGGEDLELGYRLHRQGADFCYLPQALSWHHHLRTLDQLCRLMYTYGRYSLPLLIERHPELTGLLRLGFWLESPYSPRRILLQLALSKLARIPIRHLTRIGLRGRLPDLFFDYLMWANRTRGFLDTRGSRFCLADDRPPD